jgi:hypothetical protein
MSQLYAEDWNAAADAAATVAGSTNGAETGAADDPTEAAEAATHTHELIADNTPSSQHRRLV